MKNISHVAVWVRDQEEAKDWYTQTLGFEVRADQDLGRGARWLTVGRPGQDDFEVVLETPGPPMASEESGRRLLDVVESGIVMAGIIHVDDCRATCRELESRGVELSQQPDERFYGIDATVTDPTGNIWRLVEPAGA
jgi:catechol 2,3-dioxygenase-like lactoylglutathione lyase family enzyme